MTEFLFIFHFNILVLFLLREACLITAKYYADEW